MDDDWRRRLGLLPTALEEFLEQDRRLREAIEGPYERYLREVHDSPTQRALRDILESPAARIARELEGPAERMRRHLSVEASTLEQARALTGGFSELEAATQSIQRLLGEDTLSAVAHAVELAPRWQSAIETARETLGAADASQRALAVTQSHLEMASGISAVAELRLAGLDLSTMDSVVGRVMADTLRDVTKDLAGSYSAFFDDLSDDPIALAALPPRAATWSAGEIYRHIELIETVASPRSDATPFEEEVEPEPRTARSLDPLLERLERVDPALVSAIRGARQVANTDNPERMRYVSISQREAITQVLHFFASDERVASWTTKKDQHYQNGKWTRRSRLEYIFRRFDQGAFVQLVEVDIEGLLKSINCLQAGTHTVGEAPPQIFVEKMLAKWEWALGFILEVGLEDEGDD